MLKNGLRKLCGEEEAESGERGDNLEVGFFCFGKKESLGSAGGLFHLNASSKEPACHKGEEVLSRNSRVTTSPTLLRSARSWKSPNSDLSCRLLNQIFNAVILLAILHAIAIFRSMPQKRKQAQKGALPGNTPQHRATTKDSGARRQCDLDPRTIVCANPHPPTSNRAGLLSRAPRRVCGDVRSPQPCRSSQTNQNQPIPKSPPNHDPCYPPRRPQTPPTNSSHLHHAQKCNGERGSLF